MQLSFTAATNICIFLTILHGFAYALTILRLRYRYKTARLWWDDYAAGVAGLFALVALTVIWLDHVPRSSPISTFHSGMIRYAVGVFSILASEWGSRISLALAFARIFPVGEPTRRYAIGLAILFFFLFITAIIQGALFCSKLSAWLFIDNLIQCNFSTTLVIYLVIANVLADILLIFSPLYKLRRVKLPPSQRRLIFTCIAASIFMSLSCFVTSVFQSAPMSWEPGRGYWRVLAGYLESGISLIVCNLLVVVTYIYTKMNKDRHGDVDEAPSTEKRSTEALHFSSEGRTMSHTDLTNLTTSAATQSPGDSQHGGSRMFVLTELTTGDFYSNESSSRSTVPMERSATRP